MAIKKYVAISYCFAFLFVYLTSVAYAVFSSSLNKSFDKEVLPQTIAMNSTTMAISSFSSWEGTLLTVGIAVVVLAIISFIISSRAMGMGMS
jgi:hypothetical protein